MKVLLIEDDKYIAGNIKEYLEKDMIVVDVENDGAQGCHLAKVRQYDLIILDIMLPSKDGIEICKELRDYGSEVPIIMLTARDTIDDKVKGLTIGADDYLVKPFSLAELQARIHTLMRRTQYEHFDVSELRIADLTINVITKQVTRSDEPIILTKKQFQILEYLVRNQNKVVSKQQMLHNIRGINEDRRSDVIRSHMQLLREKVDTPFPKKLIHTIRGMGFILSEKDDFAAED